MLTNYEVLLRKQLLNLRDAIIGEQIKKSADSKSVKQYQQKLRTQCRKHEQQTISKALNYFPYYFLNLQRQKFLQDQIRKQISAIKVFQNFEQKYFRKKYIIITKIDNPKDRNPIQYIYVHRKNLQIACIIDNKPTNQQTIQLLMRKTPQTDLKKQIQFVSQKNRTDQNIIQCKGQQISKRQIKLSFCLQRQSQKHGIITFILCYKKCQKYRLLGRLPEFCIRKIIEYVKFNIYPFQIQNINDKKSSLFKHKILGSFLSLSEPIQMLSYSQKKQEYRLNANFDVKLKICKIFKFQEKEQKLKGYSQEQNQQYEPNDFSYKLTRFKQRVLNYLKRLKDLEEDKFVIQNGIQQFNHILIDQDSSENALEAIILKIKTQQSVFYHILTNLTKKNYTIGNGNFDISMTLASLPRGLKQAEIRYSKQIKKWLLQSSINEGIWIKLKNQQIKPIKDKATIRIGQKNFYEIEVTE